MIRASALFLATVLGVSAQTTPKLFFSKDFPGSTPAYMEIQLNAEGVAEYREQPGEDNPIILKLTVGDSTQIFDLAGRLGHFDRKLESGLAVAKMGEKTFRWIQGSEVREQKFNYTQEPDAQALQDWFEKIADTAYRFIDLERTAQFDKLGVNRSLLILESQWDRGRLVGQELFLPLLDKISRQSAYLNMARERAAKLAVVFRNPHAKPAAKDNGQAK